MTVAPAQTNLQGITEPQPWAFDGCVRREPVLDHDLRPPRVVRRVGWHHCLRCQQPFWSEDVARLRLCIRKSNDGCRSGEDRRATGAGPGG